MKFPVLFFLFFITCVSFASTPLSIGFPFGFSRNEAINQYFLFLTDVLKDAGFEAVYKKMPGVLPYEALLKGEVDGIAYDDFALTKGREQTVTVSFPIVYIKVHVFYRVENKYFDEKNLKKYLGALGLNNSMIEKEAKRRKLKYVTSANPTQNVQLLLDKKIDYFLAVEEVGQSALSASNPELAKKIRMSERVFMSFPLYFTLNKKFKKDLPAIEASFKKHLTGDLSKYPLLRSLNKELLLPPPRK
ncbi:transporter substrate-binding domain-containing protein [Bdellovibrio sp. BCCA]|uniref:transporter substrate-binding domain-containing protein n=1 Tax=Bdellovibrio sp. BCCA TaxID=3136281 RepID=UPI0030F131E9